MWLVWGNVCFERGRSAKKKKKLMPYGTRYFRGPFLFLANIFSIFKSQCCISVPVDRITLTEPTKNIMNVTEASLESFVCETSPCRPPAKVTWFKSGGTCGRTPIGGDVLTNYTLTHNGLHITTSTLEYNITRVDQGCTINCEATNGVFGTVESTRRPQLYVWCKYEHDCCCGICRRQCHYEFNTVTYFVQNRSK